MDRNSSSNLQIKLISTFIITLMLITLTSCSTTKELKQAETKTNSEVVYSPLKNLYKPDLQSLIFLGNFSVKSNELNFDGTFRMCISRQDSLVLYVYGPFNVSIAKLLIYKSDFAICNLWQGTYYSSSIDSLKNISPLFSIPMSNIISLFIPEPFYPETKYTAFQIDTLNNQFEYQSVPLANFNEDIIIKNNNISTKKISYNELYLTINYTNYTSAFIFQLPTKVVINEQNRDLMASFTNNKFENYNTDFSSEFKIPSNLKKINKIEDLLK